MTPTARELEVLSQVVEAGSVKDAALRLGIAEATVKNHLAHMRSKFGARSTAQLVFRLHEPLARRPKHG